MKYPLDRLRNFILLILRYLVFLKKEILFNILRTKKIDTITNLLKGKSPTNNLLEEKINKFNILLDFIEQLNKLNLSTLLFNTYYK